ncbi:MAG TPA: F0F1 ATP synthase subunit gamma [Actinomycetota bacterium]|nr:F0F1 ATP synthase subunit gamma [Actinomycetota bacterium]
MGAQLRAIRRQIRSVQSTKKITRAMELIAASQIRRAQERVQQARPYAEQITRAIGDVTGQADNLEHPLLEERKDPKGAAVFVVTSDRGLAGAYSANVLRRTEELIQALREEGKEPKLYAVGRKAVGYYRFRERKVEQSWQGISERPSYDDAKEIAGTLIQAFVDREVDEIFGVFTDYVSALTQRAEARRFLPLVVEDVEATEQGPYPLYLFEPDAQTILDALVPRYVEMRVFAALLESAASEHAARQRAMKSATDNADELIKTYTRIANQARQAEITTEISEIVGGAEALAAAAAASERDALAG